MSIFGKLFGSDAAIETASNIANKSIDGILSGVDKSIYTEEEKTDTIKSVLFHLQDQYGPRALSRRIIALVFVGLFGIAFLTGLIAAGLDNNALVDKIVKLVNSFMLGQINITIVIFYFGYYGLGMFKKK